MRQLQRNCRTVWIAHFLEERFVTDENGDETPETKLVFSPPQEVRCNVSGAAGEWAVKLFGGFRDYTRTITLTGACPFREGDHVWIGIPTTKSYNYVVTRVCGGLDESIVALKEVQVDG